MEKKNILILMLSFATLVIAGSLFVFFEKQGALAPFVVGQNPQPQATSQSDCQTGQCKQIEADLKRFINLPNLDTTGWNIYKNEKFRFNLKYPKDWVFIDKDNPQYGKFIHGDDIHIISPQSFDRYYVHPDPEMTERQDELFVFINKDFMSAKNEYDRYIKEGFTDKIFLQFGLRKKTIKAFIYNTASGSITVSVPKEKKNSINFNLELFDNIPDLKKLSIIKTIINSLEFQS